MKSLRNFFSYCEKLLVKRNHNLVRIAAIAVTLLVMAAIVVYVVIYRTNASSNIVALQNNEVDSLNKDATESAEVSPGFLGNILNPLKSPPSNPTVSPSPTSTLNPTITPSSSSSFKSSSARVYLNPPRESSTPEGTGQVLIELTAIDPYYAGKIASFRVNGGVARLKPNSSYWLAFSPPNEPSGATGVLDFTTNEAGAAAVSVSGKGISYYPTSATWFIGVYPKGSSSVAAISGSFSISNDTIFGNSPFNPTSTPIVRLISIVSPQRDATYKFGELISVEIKVRDESNISKVDLAWGRQNYSFVVNKTFVSPPFTHAFRVTSPYLTNENKKLSIGAYLYDKNGRYIASDLIEVAMVPNDFSVSFKTPKDDETITGETLSIEAEVSGDKEIDKVEFYAGSGALIQTLTEKPYSFNYDIGSHVAPGNSLPLAVYAYDKEGNYVSQSINIRFSRN